MAIPGFASMVNSPAALDLITSVQARFYRAFDMQVSSNQAYTDYEQIVFPDNPAGDLIYGIYSEPLEGPREWLDARPMSQVDWNYFVQAVRKFADGMVIDLDDVKPDAGNPAKLVMYMEAAERLGEAAPLIWPFLVTDAIKTALTKLWNPDGQPIWSIHPFNPRNASLGSYRNYYANNANGGSASMPLNYPNLLARLKGGYSFKLPNGKDWPIRYTHLAVPPSSWPTALRLTGYGSTVYDRLPVAEIFGQNTSSTSAGGDAVNEIKGTYNVKPIMIANMPANQWMLSDASTPSMRGLAVKKRQPITWQYLGPSTGAGAIGNPDNDSGAVPQLAFDENRIKFGPKVRGDAYFRNWWGQVLCDGT